LDEVHIKLGRGTLLILGLMLLSKAEVRDVILVDLLVSRDSREMLKMQLFWLLSLP
jgi:hypothetical protein